MRLIALIGLFFLTSGCATTGYVPSYIISHTPQNEVEENPPPVIEQQEIR